MAHFLHAQNVLETLCHKWLQMFAYRLDSGSRSIVKRVLYAFSGPLQGE